MMIGNRKYNVGQHSKNVQVPLRNLILVILCMYCRDVAAKSDTGIFASSRAKESSGQYVSAFCFYGDGGAVFYSLNTTGHHQPTLLLYLENDWQQIMTDPEMTCEKKLSMASITHQITNTTGNQTVPAVIHPQIWHIVYADEFSCSEEEIAQDQMNYISYKVEMLNPDVLGNPTVHFSDEDIGLFRFYQLLTLVFFVLGCIYGPQMYDTLHTEGPMMLTIQLISGTLVLQGSCSFLVMMHLRSYSKDGYGAPIFVLFGELLDVISQSLMLYMMLSLSLGKSFAGIYKPIKSFSKLQQQATSRIVAALAMIQAMLLIWERYEERSHHLMFAPHRSVSGLSLAASRVVLAAVVAAYQHQHIMAERSAIKRDFYATFTKYCLLWFLCFPALVLVSWMFSPYHRYKIVCMGVVVCQTISAMFLYRLFLTRSLYWEVSSLGGSLLPLRMDKTLTMKAYS